MKPFVRVAVVESGFVTTTLTASAACGPVVAVMVVADTNVTFVAVTQPTEAVAPLRKLVPVTVIGVPPAVGPEAGVTFTSVGGSAPL